MKLLILALTVSAATAAPTDKIINGHDAVRGQFPYQVTYQWGLSGIWQHICGGTILSPTWILTAGHCITQAPPLGDFKIAVGIIDLFDQVPERQDRNVINKIVHSNFSGDIGPNDIALLQLDAPLEWSEFVKPATLPAPGAVISGVADLSGWGAVDNNPIPTMPIMLQTIDVPVLTQDECNAALDALMGGEPSPYDNLSNICTGPLVGNISACGGDSGGPLAQNGVIVGIVSWGFTPCGSEGAPSVYTSVSSFIDFITEYVTDLP